MAASSIIGALKLSGMASGAFIGSKYGNTVKVYVFNKFPAFKSSFENHFPAKSFKKTKFTEESMFNMIGSFGGIAIGYYAWPLAIPVTIVYLSKEYSSEIDKVKKYIKKD